MKRIKRKNQSDATSCDAVTSVLETLLLLSMTIGFFSVLYLSVFGFSFAPLVPSVHILATTQEGTIVLYHRGGEPLTLDCRILLKIDDVQTNFSVGDYLDTESKSDSLWGMGEQLILHGILSGDQNEITIVNGKNNAIVFHGFV